MIFLSSTAGSQCVVQAFRCSGQGQDTPGPEPLTTLLSNLFSGSLRESPARNSQPACELRGSGGSSRMLTRPSGLLYLDRIGASLGSQDNAPATVCRITPTMTWFTAGVAIQQKSAKKLGDH